MQLFLSRHIVVVLLFAAIIAAANGSNVVYKVSPGQSIQAAIDQAGSDDVILIEPGIYYEEENQHIGLRISTNNTQIIATGPPGSVRFIATGKQKIGVYAAPQGCEEQDYECNSTLHGLFIQGITIEGFSEHGIYTRWVDGFKIISTISVKNKKHGIYSKFSSNGEITSCTSTGSNHVGIMIRNSHKVTVTDTEITNNTIGLVVTTSNHINAKQNDIHENSIGVGLVHPKMITNNMDDNTEMEKQFSAHKTKDCVYEDNKIYDNNRLLLDEFDNTFMKLSPGIGMLLVDVSGHTIHSNYIENNDFTGIFITQYCTYLNLFFKKDKIKNSQCDNSIVDYTYNNDNIIENNQIGDNGIDIPEEFPYPAGMDIIYSTNNNQIVEENKSMISTSSSDDYYNFFRNNKSLNNGQSTVSKQYHISNDIYITF